MLVGAYPFEDPEYPRNFCKAIQRIMSVQYSIPDYIRISADCMKLLSRIFVANPSKRITVPEIKKRPWFLKNLPKKLMDGENANYGESSDQQQQTAKSRRHNANHKEATIPGEGSKPGQAPAGATADPDDMEGDLESEIDISGDFVDHI